jgi:hypothetical protein
MSKTENEAIFSAVEITNGPGKIPHDQSFSGTDISRHAIFVTSLIPFIIALLGSVNPCLLLKKTELHFSCPLLILMEQFSVSN